MHDYPRTNMNGSAILIGLIFLLIMTLVAISAMGHANLNEKMTANSRDQAQAFMAAESALKIGEFWIKSQNQTPQAVSSCTSTPCSVWTKGILNQIWSQNASWWSTQGTMVTIPLSNLSAQPYYIIEAQEFVPYELSPDARSKGLGYYFYKITAKGTGTSDNSNVILESIYATQYN